MMFKHHEFKNLNYDIESCNIPISANNLYPLFLTQNENIGDEEDSD